MFSETFFSWYSIGFVALWLPDLRPVGVAPPPKSEATDSYYYLCMPEPPLALLKDWLLASIWGLWFSMCYALLAKVGWRGGRACCWPLYGSWASSCMGFVVAKPRLLAPLNLVDALEAVGDSLKMERPAFDSYFVILTFSYGGSLLLSVRPVLRVYCFCWGIGGSYDTSPKLLPYIEAGCSYFWGGILSCTEIFLSSIGAWTLLSSTYLGFSASFTVNSSEKVTFKFLDFFLGLGGCRFLCGWGY